MFGAKRQHAADRPQSRPREAFTNVMSITGKGSIWQNDVALALLLDIGARAQQFERMIVIETPIVPSATACQLDMTVLRAVLDIFLQPLDLMISLRVFVPSKTKHTL